MRAIPVDTTRVQFIGTGKCAERAEYAELSDGSRRRTGQQAKDPESGLPMWVVDCLVDDDDARRAEVVGVAVASAIEPECPKGRPVVFRGLTATVYVDRASGQAKVSLRAAGIESAAGSRPIAAAGS